MFKNAESNVEKFAHDGAADSEVMEFSVFKDCDPRLKGFTPTPSDGGRHVKSFTQESVAGRNLRRVQHLDHRPFSRRKIAL